MQCMNAMGHGTLSDLLTQLHLQDNATAARVADPTNACGGLSGIENKVRLRLAHTAAAHRDGVRGSMIDVAAVRTHRCKGCFESGLACP
jgi:hypothetical protein